MADVTASGAHDELQRLLFRARVMAVLAIARAVALWVVFVALACVAFREGLHHGVRGAPWEAHGQVGGNFPCAQAGR